MQVKTKFLFVWPNSYKIRRSFASPRREENFCAEKNVCEGKCGNVIGWLQQSWIANSRGPAFRRPTSVTSYTIGGDLLAQVENSIGLIMNILPKKSWHVRTRKNIERVKRDEAEAERLSNIERDRRLRAEQEARVKELRIRAGIYDEEQDKRVDLFEGFQDAQQTSNPDYEKEQRQIDAARRVRAGLTNSLIRPEDVNKPWYLDQTTVRAGTNQAKSKLITSIYDPMTAIRHAEEIVRQRRSEKAMVKSLKPTPSFVQPSATHKSKRDADSSPEIICELRGGRDLNDRKHKVRSLKHTKHKKAHSHKTKTRHRH
jgi:hypothetical protein